MHKISGSGKARAKFDKYENKRYSFELFIAGMVKYCEGA